MKLKVRVCLVLLALLIVFAGFASDVWAQAGTTGALTGSVGNAAGDPLPAATVTLRNEATGQAQTAATNTGGAFGFPSLPPGSYLLSFSAQGFKIAQVPGVVVNVSESTVVDARLEAGGAGDPAPCLCAIAHTTSSSTGTLVDSKTITAVPLTGRNFTQVLSTAAGAAGDVNNAGLLGNRNSNVNVNGNTAGSNFALDGTSTGSVPNPDSISQFRIQTSQYDSGFGARVPTTNLVTRSGSNDFHGALWEFVRNDVFNANAFFQNANGQPKPNLKQNQFGGTVGGPIKKDKLFFFLSYQGTRQTNGLDPTSLSTLVLPPLTNDRSAAAIGSQFCPQNHPRNDGAVGASGNPFYSFAGGSAGAGVQVTCDGSNINPIALSILQKKLPDGSYLIPTPQHINAVQTTDPDPTRRFAYNLGGSSYSIPSTWTEGHYLFNTDYIISRKETLAWRFFYSHINQFRSFGSPGGAAPGGPQMTAGVPQITHFVNLATSLKLTSVLTSNIVNEVRMSFSRASMLAWGLGNPTASAFGMSSADPFFDQPPEITIQGSLGVFRFFGAGSNDFHNRDHTFQWADNLSWVHGKHTVRTGFYLDRVSEDRLDLGVARGKATFQNFTDFLLGRSAAQDGSPSGLSNVDSINANEGVGPLGEVLTQRFTTTASAFLQDDIKLKPRLTFNLGLRWEYLAPSYDVAGQMGNTWPSLLALARIPPASGTFQGYTLAANYDPNTLNPYTGKPFGPPPAGVVLRDHNSLYQDNAPLHAFAPRFGFAWQPGSKQGRISVRGGYGWFYQNPGTPSFNAPPFVQGFTNSSASNNLSTLQKMFPTPTLGFQLRTPTSQLSDRIAGPKYELALLQQWNLATQLTLAHNLTLDIGYVGSFGTHLGNGQGLNQPLLATPGHPVNCGLPNTPAGLGVDATTFAALGVDAAGCVTINTAKNAYLRVPYVGETPSALLANEFSGGSRYNGLQTTLRKQVSRGLTFQVSYTFSRTMNNTGNWFNDQNNGHLDWSRTNFDRTQRLTFNFSYEFPNLAAPGGFSGALLRDWSMSGVTSIQSGNPITLTDRSGGSIYGRASTSTITVCPGATYADLVTPGKAEQRLGGGYASNGWVNSSKICSAAPLGDEVSGSRATGYGTAGQNIMIGPGQNDWDLSVGKALRVGGLREDAQLQLRAEFYNTFNHPQFANPGAVFGTSTFGVVTQTSVGSRLIQFGVKYLF